MVLFAYWILLLIGLGAIAFEVLLIAVAAVDGLRDAAALLYAGWWLIVLICSCIILMRGIREKRAGRTGAAAGTLALLAVPSALGIGIYLFVAWMVWSGMG
jgi:hypothetical protein